MIVESTHGDNNEPSESIMALDLQSQDLHSLPQESANDDLHSSLSCEIMMNSSTPQGSNSEEPNLDSVVNEEITKVLGLQLNKSNHDVVDSDVINGTDSNSSNDADLISQDTVSFHHCDENSSDWSQHVGEKSCETLALADEVIDSASTNHAALVETTSATTFINTMEVDVENMHKNIENEESVPGPESNHVSNVQPVAQPTVKPLDDLGKVRGVNIFDMEYMTIHKYESTAPSKIERPSTLEEELNLPQSSSRISSGNCSASENHGRISLAINHTISSESDLETGLASKGPDLIKIVEFQKETISAKPFSIKPVVSFALGNDEIINSKSDENKDEHSLSTTSTFGTFKTFGTFYTLNTRGSAMTLGIDPLLKGDDAGYMTQRYGFINLILTVAQLFSLIMTLSLCGFAPIAFNYGLGPYADALSQAGALNPYLFLEHKQYWRLFTAPLMTSSLLHFLINGFFQVEAGAFIEREWGSLKWLIVYIFSAFGATTFSCIFAPNVVSVTSSSALFGVLGAKYSEFLMVLNFRTKQHRIRRDYYTQQIKVILCISMVILSMCLFSYVDVSGVLGGFMFGFASGMILLYPQLMKRKDKVLWAGTGLCLMALLVIVALIMLNETNPVEELEDVCNYYESFHYEGYNCQCLI